MLPTLDEFLSKPYPPNSYIKYQGFRWLYMRQRETYIIIRDEASYCRDVVTIANVTAIKPGNGAFTRLCEDLVGRGKAIYVECVQSERFADGLLRMGFERANEGTGYHFIGNYKGHLYHRRKITVSHLNPL